MAGFLVDVLVEVRGERLGERVVGAARRRPFAGGEGERDRCADDLMLDHEVFGPELTQARVFDGSAQATPSGPMARSIFARKRVLAVPGSTAGVLVNGSRRRSGDRGRARTRRA